MATIEKRVTFTPTARVGGLLRAIQKATGQAPSMVVRELLEEAAPALEVMLEAAKLVKTRPDQAQAAIARLAARATVDLHQAQLDLDTAIKARPGRKPGTKVTKKPGRGAAKAR